MKLDPRSLMTDTAPPQDPPLPELPAGTVRVHRGINNMWETTDYSAQEMHAYARLHAAEALRLAELERAQENKVYCQCAAHQGQMWPMWKVTVAPPTRVVCPNCEVATSPAL